VSIEPKPGLVVRYDFLWKEEQRAGIEDGKDRPCAIVLTSAEKADGSKDVLLCAITHSPPARNETAVKVPPAVAKHLGLDHEQSWIKTDQVNRLTWEKGRIPYGVSQTRKGEWSFGMIPQGLGKQVFDQVREKARSRSLQTVDRSESAADRATERARKLKNEINKRRSSEPERKLHRDRDGPDHER
jgi:mRNA-degrading endonuclease toxin of MazEF toxin-antitoxin module